MRRQRIHQGAVSLLVLAILGCGSNGCETEKYAVACPPGMTRDVRQDDLCVCDAPNSQLISRDLNLSGVACDPFDTRDSNGAGQYFTYYQMDADGVVSTQGGVFSQALCASGAPYATFVERDSARCETCACESFLECIPAGCRSTCGVKACPGGQTCSAEGKCLTCGTKAGEVQCGSGPDGCGPCASGTMCVEGFCTTFARCMTSPPSRCGVPNWCPVDVSAALPFGPVPLGANCYCWWPTEDRSCSYFNGYTDPF